MHSIFSSRVILSCANTAKCIICPFTNHKLECIPISEAMGPNRVCICALSLSPSLCIFVDPFSVCPVAISIDDEKENTLTHSLLRAKSRKNDTHTKMFAFESQ